jgi:hypothetical protein
MSDETCLYCGESCSDDPFATTPGDFVAGRKIRFVQGDPYLQGQLATIVGPFSTTCFPNLYVVTRDSDGMDFRVRWDHMMFEDRLTSNQHYRECYEQRLIGMAYTYQKLELQQAA